MANWFCSLFNVMCRKRLSSSRCRSELIDSAWVVIIPGQKCIKIVHRKQHIHVIQNQTQAHTNTKSDTQAHINSKSETTHTNIKSIKNRQIQYKIRDTQVHTNTNTKSIKNTQIQNQRHTSRHTNGKAFKHIQFESQFNEPVV